MAKSYICYDSNNLLISRIVFDAEPPVGYDVELATPTHPQAIATRSFHMEQPDAQGIVLLDCACVHTTPGEFCSCASTHQKEKIYDGAGGFADKPTWVVKVDGNVVDLETHSEATPIQVGAGLNLVLRVEIVVTDQTSVPLMEGGPSMFPSGTHLIFVSDSAEVTLTAPPPGFTACVGVKRDPYLTDFCVYVKGI